MVLDFVYLDCSIYEFLQKLIELIPLDAFPF